MNTTLHSFMNIFGTSDGTSSVQVRRIAIPPIQRDYAQGRNSENVERVRKRFLDSLYQAITGTPITLDFVYGDVDEKGTMTPLDGQQRLTTLFLLHWYAAKKEDVPQDKYAFLKNFSYETRYSARSFCEKLVEFNPSFKGNLSADIRNQEWFPFDWENDPTISSMLVMLDAIDERFKDVPNIWNRLGSDSITFYFLPIKDLGLTDELYIKMNSRGKPLTLFEHFKAELEKEMGRINERKRESLANRIAGKIDREWTDLLWNYHDSDAGVDDTIDNRFLNYFRFVCDIICYRKGESPQNHSNDVFDLIQDYFSVKNEDAKANIETLESFFDCWCSINDYENPREFLESFMGTEHEQGKIIADSIDVLGDCLNSYYDESSSDRKFPLKRVVLLYAISIYLQNQNKVAYSDFTRRIRIVNNLIQNSDNEISDRAEGSRLPAIVHAVDSIILEGVIDDSDNNFNSHQIKEEIEKAKFLAENPSRADEVFELEDHPMLNGQIGVIGLDNLDLGSRFASLFTCSWDKIDCALMTIGNYCQQERYNKWYFQFASSYNQEAWKKLFHRSSNYLGFDNTKKILIKLLETNEHFDDRILDGIIDSFTTQCETKHTYPWTYYYVKYPAFRPGSYGKMGNIHPKDEYSYSEVEPYMFAVMQTPIRWSSSTYMPFLKEADDKHLYYGDRLIYGDVYIICKNDCYAVYKNGDDENVPLETINIDQTDGIDTTRLEDVEVPHAINIDQADGIDTTDRIILLKKYLEKRGLLDEYLS